MYRKAFSLYDIFVTILSFVSYILDVLSDIAVIVLFFLDGSAVWGAVSLALVALSTFAMQIFSFCWHVTDGTMTMKTFLLHAFFLAPLHRYWRVLKLGIKSRRTGSQEDIEAVYSANNDVCLLRLFESFLESAPQLILQLYIIISFQHFDWIIGMSTFFSLTSIAWSVSAYMDGLRLAYQSDYKRSGFTMLVLTLWQITMISGRVLAIVVFASHFKEWIVLVLGIHWLVMTAWITLQNADFGDTACEKRIFNAVSGFIYIFCFLNLKDGPSRKRQTIYYIVTLMENSVLIILWFLYKPNTSPDWLSITTPTVIYGGFVVGSVMMFMYYRCCHPSMPKVKREKEVETNWFKRIATMKRREQGKTLFNTPESSFRISEWLTTSVNLSSCDRQNNSVQMSLNSSIPDIVPEKTSAQFFSGESLSTYHRAPSIESSMQESEGNLTIESGRVSYISSSSTKQLISSTAKTTKSPRYQVKAEVNQTFSPDQVSPSGYISKQQGSPRSVPSCNNSYVKSSIENSSINYIEEKPSLQSFHRESSTERLRSGKEGAGVPGSGNSSFEYNRKKISMSPLDPAKLWELSQQRITLENSRALQDSQQHGISPRSREGNSFYMTSPDAPSDSVISSRRNSSARTSHYSTTFSDSQYNSEVSGERDGANYSGTSRSQWTSQSQTGSWDNAEPSELSEFFADISSLHFPAPGHSRRFISSLSETTDPQNSSFPWPNDNDVFYDEGDISELVYKQRIREALHGKSYMYHICEISDATTPKRLSYNKQSSGSSPPFINVTQRSHSLGRISSEKSTDDSGYHYSEEAETNVNQSVNSYNRRDCVPKTDCHINLNRALMMSHTSSSSSPVGTDYTGDGTSIRKSLLPGLSYLMSDSDTSYLKNSLNSSSPFMDAPLQHSITVESCKEINDSNSQQNNVSPLQVSVIETSPHRLGRSVDLFNSSRLELSDLEGPKAVNSQFPVVPSMLQLEKLQVLELKESPYKFRERCSDHVSSSVSLVKGKDDLNITDLMESPYKFRSQGYGNTTQNKTDRKFYTIPEKREKNLDIPCRTKSKIAHEDKENRIIGENECYLAPVSRNRNKKGRKARTTYKKKCTKPRTRVSALKNSCYAYSDTDSDGEVASDFSCRSQYGGTSDCDFGFSSFTREGQNFSGKDTRTALRSVENTPIFSPIVTPDHVDRERVCNASGPIMKPVVSTPVTRSTGENRLLFIDEPSTIAV
ncbi:uncharacterized protein LOC133199560 [Saccostrea echinata]|uniref:uncharacterized protein LOC133199560 n=1 Tax=Saccostrea echinata TaxID=191078 RepID=UPI002A82A420|nr:uncharacterized protein LOC133199560 [Saccostrea echinata]